MLLACLRIKNVIKDIINPGKVKVICSAVKLICLI